MYGGLGRSSLAMPSAGVLCGSAAMLVLPGETYNGGEGGAAGSGCRSELKACDRLATVAFLSGISLICLSEAEELELVPPARGAA